VRLAEAVAGSVAKTLLNLKGKGQK